MTGLLKRVTARLAIRSARPGFAELEGLYRSHAIDRGGEFADLREYGAGDDVRDIDWTATARATTTLVRRHEARKSTVVTFVVGSSATFSGATPSGESKCDVALFAVGALAVVAAAQGDDVALVVAGARVAPGRSHSHLERMLRTLDTTTSAAAPAVPLGPLVESAAAPLRRRGIVVCVADEAPLESAALTALRALRARHTVLWLTVGDASLDVSSAHLVDLDSGWTVPAFLRHDARLRAHSIAARTAQRRATDTALDLLGIAHATVDSEAGVLPALVSLLARRSAAHG